MLIGQEDQTAGRGPWRQDLRECHFYSGLWQRLFGRTRSWHQPRPQRLPAPERQWSVGAAQQQLLHSEHAGHASRLPGCRRYERRQRDEQRQHISLAFGGMLLTLACGLGCSQHQSSRASLENPETSFRDAHEALQRGDLVRAQTEAEDGLKRYQATSPEWARRFRILDAEVVLVRGNDYRQVLS